MNNRGFPGPRPSSPGTGGGGSLLDGIGLGLLNASIRETEDRDARRALGRNIPRPPRIPYTHSPFRLPWGSHPYLRLARIGFDWLPALGWMPGPPGSLEKSFSDAGFELCCDLGAKPEYYRVVMNGQTNDNCDGPRYSACEYSVGCGTPSQVYEYGPGDTATISYGLCDRGPAKWWTPVILAGPAAALPGRFNVTQKWGKTVQCRCPPNELDVPDDIIRAPAPTWIPPDVFDKPLPPPVRLVPRLKDDPGRETGPKPVPRDRRRPRWHPHWDPPFRKPGLPPIGKDKKATPSRWEKALWAIWSAASEVPDWVDAFWDAYPEWFQDKHYFAPGNLTIDRKVKLMLDNLHLMDIEVAIKNVLENLGEDALAGKIIGLLDSVGVGVGFNGVPFLKNQHTGMWN